MNDIKIRDNDIVINSNGFPSFVSEFDTVIQQIEILSSIPKGSFAYDRELGLFTDEPDFDSDNILSTLESRINEALINEKVYVKVNELRTEDDLYYAAITVTDGIRSKETEVKIYG
ncbi:MAG: hypothetical protein IJ932_05115 [Ruminococcus sp.]|nr:hypothetical protein [Ruminococcus sp.]